MTYDIIVADPPWSYHGSQSKWAAAAKHYKTMPDAELLGLDPGARLNPSGILFLWSTCPRLDFALDCLRAWGLTYRGVAFIWIKTTAAGKPIGAQGVRPSIVKPLVELVLCASRVTKGRPLPLADEGIQQTIFAARQGHSRKPDAVQEAIERMYPTASRLEMFARRRRSGWDGCGNEYPAVGLRTIESSSVVES